MNQSQGRTIRYTVAGLGGLALLLVIGWLALREPPPSSDEAPVSPATASPHARPVASLSTPDDDASHETLTNQVAESTPIPTNAATIYRQAFAIYDALSKEDKDLIGIWRMNVDTPVAAELCEKIQPICDLMQQATAATNCDWGLEPITFMTVLPHFAPCRNLARVAVWSATHCRTGDPSAAVDDLLDASRLGQNVALTPALIGQLYDLAIQGTVIDAATMQASVLAGDPRLVQLFNDANYDEELRRGIKEEANISDRTADAMTTMSTEDAMHVVSDFYRATSVQLPSVDQTQAIADLRQIADLQRQCAQTLELPEGDYRKWLAGQQAVRTTNPFAESLLSAIEINITQTQALTVKSAMAAAGLAVMQDGTDALPSHPDPTTGQPFTYKQTAGGFELESSFQIREKSLKLSFK
jgi:hypothetical protein